MGMNSINCVDFFDLCGGVSARNGRILLCVVIAPHAGARIETNERIDQRSTNAKSEYDGKNKPYRHLRFSFWSTINQCIIQT